MQLVSRADSRDAGGAQADDRGAEVTAAHHGADVPVTESSEGLSRFWSNDDWSEGLWSPTETIEASISPRPARFRSERPRQSKPEPSGHSHVPGVARRSAGRAAGRLHDHRVRRAWWCSMRSTRSRRTQANDLAVRWNCKAGKCGSCSAEVNGSPKLMCMTRLNELAAGRAGDGRADARLPAGQGPGHRRLLELPGQDSRSSRSQPRAARRA